MDLDLIADWWPLTVTLAVFGVVALALAQCAVAEVVVRVTAWMYARDPEQRAAKREEWLCHLREMKVSERPSHAASLLWMGIVAKPPQARELAEEPEVAPSPRRCPRCGQLTLDAFNMGERCRRCGAELFDPPNSVARQPHGTNWAGG